MAGHVYALLVGIDAYTGDVPALAGCVNDVTAFGEVLRGRVPANDLTMVTVTDEDATRETVMREFTTHLGQADGQDVALFYYSGHGAHQEAPQELWEFEPDHQNETLVLVDSREPGGWDLADKELAVLISQVAASGCHLLVVLDCCHSGDATRDVDEVVRQAPPDPRHRPIESFLAGTIEQAAAQAAVAGAGTRDLDQAPRERWTPPAG
ncbi:MAG TPA: caspase family protein, partial [Humibacillus sp.]|nr:caspase family protein [Humibacillus sp.]